MQQFAVSPTPEQSVTEYEHNYAGDEIGLLTFVAMKMPPDGRGADLRKSSIRRVDLPTQSDAPHTFRGLYGDDMDCLRYFGNMSALKYLIL